MGIGAHVPKNLTRYMKQDDNAKKKFQTCQLYILDYHENLEFRPQADFQFEPELYLFSNRLPTHNI